MSDRGQGTNKRMSNRTMGLLAVLSMFSAMAPAKTKESNASHNHSGSSYGGGGRGVRDTGAIYTSKHKKMKGYQKDHKGNKVR